MPNMGIYIGIGLIVVGIIGLVWGLVLLRRQRRPSPATVDDGGWLVRELEPDEKDSGPPDEEFDTFVMGQRGSNPDGTRRQDIIATMAVGDPLTLRPEPNSPEGANTITVVASAA